MKEQKNAKQSDGLTEKAPAGVTSANSLQSGNEPPAMLLALLNSVLADMTNSQQAQILGHGMTKRGKATVLLIYGVQPTKNGTLEFVGKAAQ